MKDDFYDPPTDRQLDFYKLLGLPPQKGLTFTNISKLIDLRLDEIEKKGISVVCPHCKQETLLYYTKITLCPICKKPTFFYKGKLLTEKQAKKVDNQLLRDLLHATVDFSEDELWKEYAKDRKDEFLCFIRDECQCAREDFSHDQECAIVGFFLKFDPSKCSERKRLENLIFPAVMKPSEILKLLPPFSKCPVDCCDCDLDSIVYMNLILKKNKFINLPPHL